MLARQRFDRAGVPLSWHARKRMKQRSIPASVVQLAARCGVRVADPDGRGQEVRLVTPGVAGRHKDLKGWVGVRVVIAAGQVRTVFRDDWRRAWRQW